MTAAAPLPALSRAELDFRQRFIPEEFTPLFHTPLHRQLPAAARLRYNQLHAFYFNEQIAFFEEEMLAPALRALLRGPLPESMRAGLQTFLAEEQRHTALFRALNRQAAPQLYGEAASFFVQLPRWARWPLRQLVNRPRRFPLTLWLALLQEERSLYYSSRALTAGLEPHFTALHRAHLADEVGHVRWDEELLDWLWPRLGPSGRALNARGLGWLLGRFFHFPERAGVRVVEQLAREFPQLSCSALRRALRELRKSETYPHTLYSRTITPRAFARFDTEPAFGLLARVLPGYHPAR